MPEGLSVRTPTLEIGYEAHGNADGFPVVLLHGFPDDVRGVGRCGGPAGGGGVSGAGALSARLWTDAASG